MKRKLLFAALCVAFATGGGNSLSAQTDVTSTYITNADFNATPINVASKKADVGTKGTNSGQENVTYTPTSWTLKTYSDNCLGATVPYGFTYKMNGATVPSTDSNGNSEGAFLFLSVGWSGTIEYTTSEITLAPGNYKLTYNAKNVNNGKTGMKSRVGFIPTSGSGIISTKNSFTYNSWDTDVVSFTIETSTSGKFCVGASTSGAASGSQGSGNYAKIFIDGLTLTYTDFKAELRAVVAQAQAINARISTLSDDIATAQGVLNTASSSKTEIDEAVTTLRNAISTKLAAYTGLDAAGDDITSFLANNGFETSPTFDGTSLGSGSDPKSNATPTVGSTLLLDAKNVYQVNGWELLTTETSDFARTFTMPYDKTLYVWGNNAVAGQAVASPTNGSSVTTSNDALLFVEANWCENAVLGVKQTVPLPAGSYRLTFDTYVSNAIGNAESRCGVSYGETTNYKWPAALNTWTKNEVDFTLDAQTDVTISMGYKKIGNVGGGSSAHLFIDNVKLTYFDPLKLAQIQWQETWDALDALDETVLPDASKTAITNALAETEPTTVDGYNTAKDALQDLIDSYDDIKAAYDKVNALITLATNEKDYSTGDKSTFTTAINTATTNIETRTTADDLTNDYNTLETARQTYVTSGATPNAGHPFDYTFKLSNPSFEDGNDVWNNDWTTDRNTTGNFDYKYVAVLGETAAEGLLDGEKVLNAWAPQINWINVKQNITLPEGCYQLTASAFSDKIKNQHIAAKANNKTFESLVLESGSWQMLSVEFNVSEESSVTVGMYSNGNNMNNDTNGWYKVDNFKLYYLGQIVTKTSSANLEGYKTFYDADYNYQVDDNTTIYKAASPADGYVHLTAVDGRIIPAGTPVILKTSNTTGYEITLTPTATESGDDFADNVLHAAVSDGVIDGAYIMAYTTADGLGFYPFDGSLDKGDVYLTIPTLANSRCLTILADNEATGINGVGSGNAADKSNIYNLSGQQVTKGYKGVVIKNGKKMMVK